MKSKVTTQTSEAVEIASVFPGLTLLSPPPPDHLHLCPGALEPAQADQGAGVPGLGLGARLAADLLRLPHPHLGPVRPGQHPRTPATGQRLADIRTLKANAQARIFLVLLCRCHRKEMWTAILALFL